MSWFFQNKIPADRISPTPQHIAANPTNLSESLPRAFVAPTQVGKIDCQKPISNPENAIVNIISWTSLFLQTFQADCNISFGVVWSSAGTGNVLTLFDFQM